MPQFIPPDLATSEQRAVLALHHIEALMPFEHCFQLVCSCGSFRHTEGFAPTPEHYAAAGELPPIIQAMHNLADAGLDHIVEEIRKAGVA